MGEVRILRAASSPGKANSSSVPARTEPSRSLAHSSREHGSSVSGPGLKLAHCHRSNAMQIQCGTCRRFPRKVLEFVSLPPAFFHTQQREAGGVILCCPLSRQPVPLNSFGLTCKNIIPLSFSLMQTQSRPRGQLKLNQPHLHDTYW